MLTCPEACGRAIENPTSTSKATNIGLFLVTEFESMRAPFQAFLMRSAGKKDFWLGFAVAGRGMQKIPQPQTRPWKIDLQLTVPLSNDDNVRGEPT
jgi:hypothetical protein